MFFVVLSVPLYSSRSGRCAYDARMADWKIVRCSGGAYYESKWVPGGSFKAVRLGGKRFQKCPVHHKWEMAERVPEDLVTPEIRVEADSHRDSGMI